MPSPRACLAALVIAVATLPAPASAGPDEDLEAAQRRANRAAEELNEAETELAHAEDAVASSQTRVERLDARMASARDQVRELAVRLYVEGTGGITRLLRIADANELVRAQQYSHAMAGVNLDALRQFRADREDLGDEVRVLARNRDAQAESLESLRERQARAVAELERLSQVAAEARAAAAREAARANRAASPAVAAAGPPAGQAATESSPSPVPFAGPATTRPAPAATASPAAAEPPPAAPAAAAPAASGDWICPVQGPHAFSNDYGAPRGGGYSHMGNDILAAKGTPVVASVSGAVRQRNGSVSGLAYYLDGDDGNEYFGAHLDSFGASGRVVAGTVIGTVGNSGDAAGGPPHLHFEIHPGGSGNINPYPTLTKYC